MKYLRLIRMKHWLKNCLVFLPLFFGGKIFDSKMLLEATIGFFVFSFSSSVVYINNDINDIEKDRKHPIKKKRSLASGEISQKLAMIIEFCLLILALAMMILLWYVYERNIFVFIIPVLYLILNFLYSRGLKNVPIIDVVILVSGFILRVMYGGVVTAVEVSKYLYLMVMFGAFYLGFGK